MAECRHYEAKIDFYETIKPGFGQKIWNPADQGHNYQ